MNNKEANRIIENYKPLKGFFDLSKKPKTLANLKYAKVLKIQEYLAQQETNKKYLKKFEPIQWQELKELSADYQAIVLGHWKLY